MKNNVGYARAASPRCSRSVWRSASSALFALLLAACGAAVTPAGPQPVPYVEVATSAMSAYEGEPTIIVGASDASRGRIAQFVTGAGASSDRVLVAVFQGAQRTGGYAIRIDRIEREGDRLVVHATFTEPVPGAVVTQVLTSPVHVVSIALADITGATQAVLLDASGTERARATVG